MRTCSKCNESKQSSEFYASQPHGYCKPCSRLITAARWKVIKNSPEQKARQLIKQRKYRALNPDKKRAHNAVYYAVRVGKIKRGNCQDCGAGQAEAHHADYSKPLEIAWLCFECHRKLHGRFSSIKEP